MAPAATGPVQPWLSDETKKVVRAYGKLVRTDDTTERTYADVFWARGPVKLTSDEWWLTRLSLLRNAIVHGDEVPEELWQHERKHQLNHIHDRLIECLLAAVAAGSGDPLLRMRGRERMFDRIAEGMAQRLREAEEGKTSGDYGPN